MADDYAELFGRARDNEPSRVLFWTRGVATLETDSTAPKPGGTLAGVYLKDTTAFTFPPVCMKVHIDEKRYPKRKLFEAIWEAPITRAEFAAL